MTVSLHVQARCVECGAVWWLLPGTVEPGEMPECPHCSGLGVATGARADDDDRRAYGLRRGQGAGNPKTRARRRR